MNSPYRHETLFVEECAAYYLIAGKWFVKKGDNSMGFYLGTDVYISIINLKQVSAVAGFYY